MTQFLSSAGRAARSKGCSRLAGSHLFTLLRYQRERASRLHQSCRFTTTPIQYTNSIMQQMKKVELHVHLDGSMRPETIFELGQKKNIKLPGASVEELKPHVQAIGTKDLTEFLSKFAVFMPTIVGDLEGIERISYEFCEDTAKQGIIYSEVRYAPHFLTDDGKLTLDQVVQAVNKGIERGCKQFNVKIRTILCCMRHIPDWSKDILDLCIKYKDSGVVGIDLAGDENTFGCPTNPAHIKAFQEAKKAGIHRTVHAGENGPAKNVKEAIEEMHAERLGHGYHSLYDEVIYKLTRDHDVHYEICPHSSYTTGAVAGFKDHPILKFAADDINFSINTDDTCVTGRNMVDDYELSAKLGLTRQQIIKSNFNAARSCFLPESEKKDLINELKQFYKDETPAGV